MAVIHEWILRGMPGSVGYVEPSITNDLTWVTNTGTADVNISPPWAHGEHVYPTDMTFTSIISSGGVFQTTKRLKPRRAPLSKRIAHALRWFAHATDLDTCFRRPW